MKPLWACIPVVILLAVRECRCQRMDPCLKFFVTEKGLIFLVRKALDYLKVSLQRVSLNNFKDAIKKKAASITYSTSNGKIIHIGPTEFEIRVVSETLRVNFSMDLVASVDYQCERKQKADQQRSSGRILTWLRTVQVRVITAMPSSPNGGFLAKVLSCLPMVKSVEMNFTGGEEELHSVMKYFLTYPLKSSILKLICDTIDSEITSSGSRKLARWPKLMKISNRLMANYAIVALNMADRRYVEVQVNGRFVNDSGDQESVSKPPPGMFPSLTGMVEICISDVTLNSALRVELSGLPNFIHITIANPTLANLAYYTLMFTSYVPVQTTKKGLELFVHVVRMPTVRMSRSGIFLHARLGFVFVVLETNGTSENVTDIAMDVRFRLQPHMIENTFLCTIDRINTSLYSISLKSYRTLKLYDVLSELVKIFLPSVNNFLRNGIPLPFIQGFRFTLIGSKVSDGYVVMSLSLSPDDS